MKYTRQSLALVKLINVINNTLFLYVANASLELLCLTLYWQLSHLIARLVFIIYSLIKYLMRD